jgi:flagellar motor component MotA
MGKAADGLKTPEDLEREVEEIRAHMAPVIAELDHRRHALLDWRSQLKRRGPALAGLAAAVMGVVVAVRLARRRRRERFTGPWW